MAEYIQRTNWKEYAVNILPFYFRQPQPELQNSLNWKIEAIGELIQEIENQIPLILQQANILQATGIHLDRFGVLLGLARDPLWTDDIYRILLLSKAVSNRSTGIRSNKYSILKILGIQNPFVIDLYPATNVVQVLSTDAPFLTPDLLSQLMRSCSLQINLLCAIYSPTYFGWDDDASAFGFDEGELAEDGDEPYLTPLATPTGLTQTSISFDTISIEWNAVEGATGYRVNVFDITDNETILCLDIGNVLSYIITDLMAGHDYEIRVRAIA